MTYREKLRDRRWIQKREEILERDLWSCTECGAQDERLQVHHIIYQQGLEPWEYPDWCYKTLCRTCHENRHAVTQELLCVLSRTEAGMIEELSKALVSHSAVNSVSMTSAIAVAVQALKSNRMDALLLNLKTL